MVPNTLTSSLRDRPKLPIRLDGLFVPILVLAGPQKKSMVGHMLELGVSLCTFLIIPLPFDRHVN